MTEFPWDIKKGSDGKSSGIAPSTPELPAFLTGAEGPDRSVPSSGTSIPDILANAFSGAPMEEARIEMPSFGNKPDNQPINFTPPSFQNMDDISALFSKTPNSPEPPFLKVTAADISPKKADMPQMKDVSGAGQLSLTGLNAPPADTAGVRPPIKAGKRSPPPLFKLKLPEDDSQKTEALRPAGLDIAEPPALRFTQGDSGLSERSPQGYGLSPDISPDNHISPSGNSLPEHADTSPNPFKNLVSQHIVSSPSEDAGETSPFPQINQQGPFTESMVSRAAPPSGQVPFSGSPFSQQAQPQDNPFADPLLRPVGTLAGQHQSPVNPFAGQLHPSGNPFPGPASQSSGPFTPSSAAGSPFPGTSPPSPDPFAGALKPSPGPFPGKTAESHSFPAQGSRSPLLRMDVLRKNLDDAGATVKSLFRGLVTGRSLIERMEGLRDEPVTVGASEMHSPFTSDIVPPDPFSGMSGSRAKPSVKKPSVKEGTAPAVNAFSQEKAAHSVQKPPADALGDIRKVTPIEEPLMELKEEHRIDIFSEEYGETCDQEPDSELLKSIPAGKVTKEHSVDRGRNFNGACDPAFREDTFSRGDYKVIEGLSSELGDVKAELGVMLSRFADIDSKVLCISSSMEDIGCAVAGLKEGEQRITDTAAQLQSLIGKTGALEKGIGDVRSDNSDIRAGLARMEESISELVSSYTALLVQMHESAQEADERFSQLENTIKDLSPMEARLRTLERSHGESQSMSMELAKSISSLMDGLGATSEDLREFKEASELDHSKLKENLSLMTEYVDSELRKVGARSYKGYGQNVHLSSITKNSTNMKLCMEWLEFLMGLVGRNNLPDILSYYEELGWITEQVRSELMHYAEGIDFYMEKPDWKLTPDDHVKSIWFIESLAGLKVDKNRLSVIDRDIEKVKKGTEIYGI